MPRFRVRAPDGKQKLLDPMPSSTSITGLQMMIKQQLNLSFFLKPELIQIKYLFPPAKIISDFDPSTQLSTLGISSGNLIITTLATPPPAFILAQKRKAARRISKELQNLTNNPPKHIVSIYPVDGDLLLLRVRIRGIENTLYEDGEFELEIKVQESYPFCKYIKVPLKMCLLTKVYHPYIHENGAIHCHLQDDTHWSPGLTIAKWLELISINWMCGRCDDICRCTNCAFNLEMLELYKTNRQKYEQIAKKWTNLYAKRYPLVSGHLREEQRRLNINFPQHLQRIIMRYHTP